MPSTRFGVAEDRGVRLEAPGRSLGDRVDVAAGRELEHREQRQDEVAEHEHEDDDPGQPLAQRGAAALAGALGRFAISAPPPCAAAPSWAGRTAHLTHLEARRWIQA